MKHTLRVSLVIMIFGKVSYKHELSLIIRVNQKKDSECISESSYTMRHPGFEPGTPRLKV